MSLLVIIGLALAVAAAFGAWTYRFELGPCPRCSGRVRGSSRWSRRKSYNRRCGRCGGSGERIRPMALIWPRHREAARRRKEEIRRKREASR